VSKSDTAMRHRMQALAAAVLNEIAVVRWRRTGPV
jgi:hypothetical protein